MSLQFIIGSTGSGKTYRLYKDLIALSAKQPEGRFFAVVPEQFTMQTQKEIVSLHPDHGVMNIDIVSFERLAYRIFEELSVESLYVLDDMGKSMVLRKVAAGKKRQLKLFGSHLEKVGFISEIKSMLSEFFQYGISEERLSQMAETADSAMLKQKLSDMLVLYKGFKEYSEGKLMAKEELLNLLCEVLKRSEMIKDSIVTFDSFTGFTPVQYRVLELLLVYCKRVIVTVTMAPGENPYKENGTHHLFHLSKSTVCRLTELATRTGARREDDILIDDKPVYRFRESPALGFIEQELFRFGKRTYDEAPDNQLSICRAENTLCEVTGIAAGIQRLVKEEGYRYRDIAVVAGGLENYSREIIRQFDQNQIPYFIDYKKNILGNPMVEMLRTALAIVQEDFSYESVFRYLKTGLVTEKKEELNRLENYVIALGIRGFKRWNTEWTRVYRGAELINLLEINTLREEILSPILPLREKLKEKKSTVGDRTEALVHFLMALSAEEKLINLAARFRDMGEVSLEKEYIQVYGLVIDLLDRLTALLGDEKVSAKEFSDILDAGFTEIKVGLIPAVVDRVVVGDLTRTRLSHIKALFFAGVNDGLVPAVSGRGGILTESERKRLKEARVELAPTAREEGFLQRLYLYLVMCKPSERLYLSYSATSSDGKSLRPSSLIGQVMKLFPALKIKDMDSEEQSLWSLPAGKEQVIQAFKEYGTRSKNPHFLETLSFFLSTEEYKEEMERLVEAAFYTYEERGLGRTAAKELYSDILGGSVTRMERYAACAYSHFLAYGLELAKRPVFELAASDIGNLFHSSIDLYFKKMKEENRSFRNISEEERERLVSACVLEVTEQYGNTILSSSARNAYLAKKVHRITDRTVWALTEQLKKGDFEPSDFEVTFTPADNLHAMKIPVSDVEAIHLKGRIDRIDLCEDGDRLYVKIIDYKTGKTKFELPDLFYGLQMQLVVYMDAALEKEQRLYPHKKVVPAGIFYYNIADPLVEKQADMGEEQTEALLLRQLRMNGLVNSEMDVIEHLDSRIETESDVIPVAMKAGILQEAKSSVANEERFEHLRKFVNKKLKSMGREILDGRIAVDPYKKGPQSSCDYCPYRSVCGFDTKTDGYGFRRFKKMKPEEIWEEIEGTKEKEETVHGHELDEGTKAGN